jgi:hypothetical protein
MRVQLGNASSRRPDLLSKCALFKQIKDAKFNFSQNPACHACLMANRSIVTRQKTALQGVWYFYTSQGEHFPAPENP